MFSAVTSAFIIQVDSKLQSDPNDETAALLRVLIYKIDNTTFGNDIPALPRWTGPPRTIVQVQAILFSSLAISLLSAFLAMLGKRWLNRYESVDMRGSAIERSHNRQRKLGGIVGWRFDHVMELLPSMLQAALLLLGCALSRYLWETNITIASVVLGVTSLGVISYALIVVTGTASESCPYQTPAAHILRHILHHLRHHLLPILCSAPAATSAAVSSNFSRLYLASWCCRGFFEWWSAMKQPWYSMKNILNALFIPVYLFVSLSRDVYCLGQTILRFLVVCGRAVYHQLLGSHRTAHRWFVDISALRGLSLGQRTIVMDLRCISWILQTSLDKDVHLSAFEHLISMPELAHFNPTLVFDCFNVFIRCISISNGKVEVMQGMKRLATASADGFFRILHHLATIHPTSRILADLQRHYNQIFPSDLDFTGLPFHSTMNKIHALAGRFGSPRDIRWHGYKMSTQEHIPFAKCMVQAARDEYQRLHRRKVPRWILHLAFSFLSLGSVSPPSVVADCLTIIAIDLGCDIPIPEEGYVQI